jgi:hypothetical protein
MTQNCALTLAYRVVGALSGLRRVVNAGAAFAGYAHCDARAQVDLEGHLSTFSFGRDFHEWMAGTGSTRGFDGRCWAQYIWWDLDRPRNLGCALDDTCRLTSRIHQDLGLGGGEILVLFSGGKGFHVGLPTALWNPEPCDHFNLIARQFTERIAESAGVKIDPGIYGKTSSLRAPNSRHPKTGLHKRQIEPEWLERMSREKVLALATKPSPFEPPEVQGGGGVAAEIWQEAMQIVEHNRETYIHRNGESHLNRLTLDFICSGAPEGERERRLFSAAANLAEFGCPPELAYALLSEAARDSGLTPSEVRHNVEGGLKSRRTKLAKEGVVP